jgi:hypothetical protein
MVALRRCKKESAPAWVAGALGAVLFRSALNGGENRNQVKENQEQNEVTDDRKQNKQVATAAAFGRHFLTSSGAFLAGSGLLGGFPRASSLPAYPVRRISTVFIAQSVPALAESPA